MWVHTLGKFGTLGALGTGSVIDDNVMWLLLRGPLQPSEPLILMATWCRPPSLFGCMTVVFFINKCIQSRFITNNKHRCYIWYEIWTYECGKLTRASIRKWSPHFYSIQLCLWFYNQPFDALIHVCFLCYSWFAFGCRLLHRKYLMATCYRSSWSLQVNNKRLYYHYLLAFLILNLVQNCLPLHPFLLIRLCNSLSVFITPWIDFTLFLEFLVHKLRKLKYSTKYEHMGSKHRGWYML